MRGDEQGPQDQDDWDDWDENTEITPLAGRAAAAPQPGFDMVIEDDEDDLEELMDLPPDALVALDEIDEPGDPTRATLHARDRDERWRLGPDLQVLGGDGGIPVAGSVLERCAEISWTERGHLLRKRSRRGEILVNGEPVSEHLLQPGDLLELARDAFVYVLD
jgi:hypothetical protein